MTGKTWVVTLSPGEDVAAAQRRIKDAGFEVSAALSEIGVITGTGADDTVDRVRAIPGIADVAEDASIDVGPPGSSVTW